MGAWVGDSRYVSPRPEAARAQTGGLRRVATGKLNVKKSTIILLTIISIIIIIKVLIKLTLYLILPLCEGGRISKSL